MNFDRLRFVSERAEIGEQREAVFGVTIPEERGSFKRFCNLVGKRNVTEFSYRIAEKKDAHVFVGLQIQSASETKLLAKQFKENGFSYVDLTNDELGKSHIRHLVGGRTELANDEEIGRASCRERV